uniref:Orcokinin n=1 Tax=Strongyloides stercoralis TaxID=6248 RepID=A0A0K0EKE5_STRER
MTTNYWDLKKISKLIFILSLITGNTNGISNDNYMTAIKKSPLDFAAITSQLGSAERMRYGKRSMLSEIGEYDNVGKRSNDYIPQIVEFDKFGKRSSYNQVLPIYDNAGKRSYYPFYDSDTYYYDSIGKRLSSIIKNVAEYNQVGKRSNGLVPHLIHYDDFGKRTDDFDNLNYYYQHGKRSPNLNAIIQHLNDVDRLRFGK